MKQIIGRKPELERLNTYYKSGKAEFVALYGRRRVGKTFLIHQFFGNRFDFDTTGVMNGSVNAFGHFWNSWANWQPEIMLIVCGSATSWMVRNIIDNHGGLHDRITHEMPRQTHLSPSFPSLDKRWSSVLREPLPKTADKPM